MANKILIIGVMVLFIVLLGAGVGIYFFMSGEEEPPVTPPKVDPVPAQVPAPVPSPVPAPVPAPPPVKNDQSWRDNNPGAVIATFSTECLPAKTFDKNVKYKGLSNDNYANYCYELVKSQSPSCRVEVCKNPNVYGACKDECK